MLWSRGCLWLCGHAGDSGFAPAATVDLKAKPAEVGVCTCMRLGGQGSRTPVLPGAWLLD